MRLSKCKVGRQVGAQGLAGDVLISGGPDRPHGRVAPSLVPRSTFDVALSTSPLLPSTGHELRFAIRAVLFLASTSQRAYSLLFSKSLRPLNSHGVAPPAAPRLAARPLAFRGRSRIPVDTTPDSKHTNEQLRRLVCRLADTAPQLSQAAITRSRPGGTSRGRGRSRSTELRTPAERLTTTTGRRGAKNMLDLLQRRDRRRRDDIRVAVAVSLCPGRT
jgi:hypothetical protein